MAGTCPHLGTHHLLYRAGTLAIIQKRNRAFDRKSGHDAQPVLLRRVQQPEWWRRVSADRVHTRGRHPGKVPVDHLQWRELFALFVWTKRAVGDAAKVEFFLADEKEFALDP